MKVLKILLLSSFISGLVACKGNDGGSNSIDPNMLKGTWQAQSFSAKGVTLTADDDGYVGSAPGYNMGEKAMKMFITFRDTTAAALIIYRSGEKTDDTGEYRVAGSSFFLKNNDGSEDRSDVATLTQDTLVANHAFSQGTFSITFKRVAEGEVGKAREKFLKDQVDKDREHKHHKDKDDDDSKRLSHSDDNSDHDHDHDKNLNGLDFKGIGELSTQEQ